MKSFSLVIAMVISLFALCIFSVGCGPSEECEGCDTTADCAEGLYCASFERGGDLCAYHSTQYCKVPY